MLYVTYDPFNKEGSLPDGVIKTELDKQCQTYLNAKQNRSDVKFLITISNWFSLVYIQVLIRKQILDNKDVYFTYGPDNGKGNEPYQLTEKGWHPDSKNIPKWWNSDIIEDIAWELI